MSLILWAAKFFSPNFFQLAKQSNSIQVITICFSHYCELAVWSLTKAGLKFDEYHCAPGQHVLPALSVRVGDKKNRHLSTSSAMNDKKSARSTAVPLAVLPDGKVLVDSWEIAQYSGLPPVDSDLKKILDEDVGVLARKIIYCHVLQPQNKGIFDELVTNGRGWFWNICWYLFVGNHVRKLLMKLFNVKDTQAVAECKQKMKEVTERLDNIIKSRSTQFIRGNEISINDIALASLFAPLVCPPLYYGGKFTRSFNKLIDQDSEARKEVEYWRQTITGQYVLDLYNQHRL